MVLEQQLHNFEVASLQCSLQGIPILPTLCIDVYMVLKQQLHNLEIREFAVSHRKPPGATQ
jgi:hypothetical protein